MKMIRELVKSSIAFFITVFQKVADFIVDKIKNTKNDNDSELWFDLGMKMNRWCVGRNIWLR